MNDIALSSSGLISDSAWLLSEDLVIRLVNLVSPSTAAYSQLILQRGYRDSTYSISLHSRARRVGISTKRTRHLLILLVDIVCFREIFT